MLTGSSKESLRVWNIIATVQKLKYFGLAHGLKAQHEDLAVRSDLIQVSPITASQPIGFSA